MPPVALVEEVGAGGSASPEDSAVWRQQHEVQIWDLCSWVEKGEALFFPVATSWGSGFLSRPDPELSRVQGF